MRQYEVIITPAAENDLQEIFTYIATELLEPQTAINLCDRIEQEILKLDTVNSHINPAIILKLKLPHIEPLTLNFAN